MSNVLQNIKNEIHIRFLSWLSLSPLSDEATDEERELYRRQFLRKVNRKILWTTLIFAFWGALFLWLGSLIAKTQTGNHHHQNNAKGEVPQKKKKKTIYICSMHPNIKTEDPTKKCPICFMDLTPMNSGDENIGPDSPVINLTSSARALAKIESEVALYRRTTHVIKMVGKVDYDETRVVSFSLWTSGRSRIKRMFINFTGAMIKKGDPLVEIYSPDIIAAQGEYLAAYRRYKRKEKQSLIKSNFIASRQKLLNLGMTEKQIKSLEKKQKMSEVVRIYSPVTGTVIAKLADEGQWHNRGMAIYKIADLSRLWGKIDVYESDLVWIHYGQKVEFQAEAYPGRKFYGRISFIDPFLNEKTRTVKIRVNINNKKNLLKPGMFVRASIKAKIANNGEVWNPELVGKWICPVHPEIIRSQKGICKEKHTNIGECKKWLIPAVAPNNTEIKTRILTIPITAPLITGKRAVVYVEQKQVLRDYTGRKKGEKYRYEGREIVLGPKVGQYYMIFSGLEEGERVVTKGAFKIDSALQILARPSMMNPKRKKEKKTMLEEVPIDYKKYTFYYPLLSQFMEDYIKIGDILSKDKKKNVMNLRANMLQILKNIHQKSIKIRTPSKKLFISKLLKVKQMLLEFGGDLKNVRRDYLDVSEAFIDLVKTFGHKYHKKLYLMFCPMYRHDLGGEWIQDEINLRNPYYGSEMYRCGEMRKRLSALEKSGE